MLMKTPDGTPLILECFTDKIPEMIQWMPLDDWVSSDEYDRFYRILEDDIKSDPDRIKPMMKMLKFRGSDSMFIHLMLGETRNSVLAIIDRAKARNIDIKDVEKYRGEDIK